MFYVTTAFNLDKKNFFVVFLFFLIIYLSGTRIENYQTRHKSTII